MLRSSAPWPSVQERAPDPIQDRWERIPLISRTRYSGPCGTSPGGPVKRIEMVQLAVTSSRPSRLGGEPVQTLVVPASLLGGRYRALQSIDVIDRPASGERLLAFGRTGDNVLLALDSGSSSVVEILGDEPSRIVNSSLDRFIATVRAVHHRFPFYDRDAADAVMDRAADDLLRIVEQVDPEAVIPDRFWSTFVDDVRMGDFSTQAVDAAENQA